MIGKFIEKWKMLKAVKAIQKEPIYLAAVQAGQTYLTDESQGIGKYASKELKQKLAEEIMGEVNEVILAPNQLMANREKLAAYTLQMAKYQVLIFPGKNEDEDDTTGLRDKPEITGELKSHFKKIAEEDKDIKELACILEDPSDKEIYEACLFRYWLFHLKAHVFQTIRMALNDTHHDPEKDWYREFVAAMCAWEEYNYRKLIGLPDVLEKDDDIGSLEVLKYSTFMDIVLSGAKYPNFEWKETYKDEK